MLDVSRARIALTATVEDDHDPEWIADAVCGALSNEHGLDCTYGQSNSWSPSTDSTCCRQLDCYP